MEGAVTILQKHGVTVAEVSFPPPFADADRLKHIQRVITHGEAKISFLREYKLDKEKLAGEIRDIVENSAGYTYKERMEAEDTYDAMRHAMSSLAEDYTAILPPSAVDEAPVGLDDMGRATFNTMWTVGGLNFRLSHPAILN